MADVKLFKTEEIFELEAGGSLHGITIAYHTYGKPNAAKNNVVWVCHALTADSDVEKWWPGLVGKNAGIDPGENFIVCANILGSCYGSTGPLSTDPATGTPFFGSFPFITIRDMVRAHILLRKHLGIEKIALLMGGSMGGYQALEWCLMEKDVVNRLFLIATSAAETAWGIAIHTAQRFAIEADSSWQRRSPHAGAKGLKAARAIGMLSYRNYALLVKQQSDPDSSKLDHFKASSYMEYQGKKLVDRFNAVSYWLLTKAMDSHNLARGRGDIEKVLQGIKQKTLILAISSDILCPVQEQQFLAAHIPGAAFFEIDSEYGHDGFIVEGGKISAILKRWMDD